MKPSHNFHTRNKCAQPKPVQNYIGIKYSRGRTPTTVFHDRPTLLRVNITQPSYHFTPWINVTKFLLARRMKI